ncbi:MAG: cell division protein ZapA [Leptospiraceae bacterium]|nr:cell division protein ZapA [Leptospiraceae bacterium]
METSPSRVKVRILEEDYTILGETDQTTIVEIARMVDERCKELQASLPSASKTRIAILCALNIADELHQAKNLNEGSEPSNPLIEEKTKKIISLLEEGIIGDIYP